MNNKMLFNEIACSCHILSLAVIYEHKPYSASLFYVYSAQTQCLVVASSHSTRHVQAALRNPCVSGTIAPLVKDVQQIKGIQFIGKWYKATKQQEKLYTDKFPYSVSYMPHIWSIELQEAKVTHNAFLGLGNKIIIYFNDCSHHFK